MDDAPHFTAFAGYRLIATGELQQVAVAAAGATEPVLIFEDATGAPVELDLRHGADHAVQEFRARDASSETQPVARPGRGRPRLGVVAREVTLLPRHWAWLATRPGGASAALRRLVEDARRAPVAPDQRRQAQEAIYRIMSTLAGNLPGFEEASRALFAGDEHALRSRIEGWPPDVAAYLQTLLRGTPLRLP